METIDGYIREVRRGLVLEEQDRYRLEDDLWSHYRELVQSGCKPDEALRKMGPPDAVCREFMHEQTWRYAGIVERFTAFLVDMALLFLFSIPVLFLAMVFWQQSYTFLSELDPSLAGFIYSNPFLVLLYAVKAVVASMLIASAMAVVLLYWPFWERLTGTTPGKYLLGLKVIREDGSAVDWKESFLRRLSFYFDIIAIDAVFIVLNAGRQRAFDMVAKTVVLREPLITHRGRRIVYMLLLISAAVGMTLLAVSLMESFGLS